MRTKNQPQTKSFHFLLKIILTVIFYFAWNSNLIAQENNFSKIVEAFQDYSKAYREVVYCHLNKSTYIKGEYLGFSAYILNKDLKTPSKTTKNLYCLILDSTNTIVKSKLIKVNNGFSHNIFKLDSLFSSGTYTFKAYTNWMKNFDEPNMFMESFQVIDPTVETTIVNNKIENELDVQFLPEGGHFVNLLRTNVGVVIKNKKGYGVANVMGSVYDTNDKYITEFTTNSLGIGRFPLYTEIGEKYYVKIKHLNKSFQYIIDNIESKGIALQVNKLNDNLMLDFMTNNQTFSEIARKPYKLFNHNGKGYKMVNIQFDKEDLIISIQDKDLFPGINIFTLFNEENEPVLERMFFNYKGINFHNLKAPVYSKLGDSLRVSIPLEDPRQFGYHEDINVSISVLPEETKSYNKHQNLVSYIYLQPYVNGYIENAAYYFTDISSKKEYDLDNLLITQGWSSYKWNSIFDNKGNNEFVFEDGIVVKVNNTNTKNNSIIIYPLHNNQGYVIDLPEENQSFLKEGFYPEDNETLNMGVLNRKGEANKANLYVQFSPSKTPDFTKNYFKPLSSNRRHFIESSSKPFTLIDLDEVQNLDEVFIKTSAKQTKIENLKLSPNSKVDVFDDTKRAINLTLSNYINAYMNGFTAYEQMGVLSISNGKGAPLVFLNDMLLSSNEFLLNFDMSTVDYIAYNRHAVGEGGRNNGSGVIKIYTSNTFSVKNRNHESFRQFEFPLTFSKNKKFYRPMYNVYDNDFFKEYGVIDWIPSCKLDEKGNLYFTISNQGNNNINFFIEGVSQNGTYFLDTKRLTIRE